MEAVWSISSCLFFTHLTEGQLINIALHKPASMSSSIGQDSLPASGAVDGTVTTTWPDIINTATGQTQAWWKVDLEREVQKATFKIYFRTDFKIRRNGVQIYTSTTPFSSYPEGQLCHTVTGDPSGSDIDDVVSVTCPGRWRYLLIYTNTDNNGQGPFLDFGEVEVIACRSGYYGPDCGLNCTHRHCEDPADFCPHQTGQCSCQPGWKDIDCTQVCDSNYYGFDCNKSCSSRKCLNSSSCDHVTGQCEDGCKSGYNGTDCLQMCTYGTYGSRCSQLCSYRHCLISRAPCDNESGSCNGDCKPGWRGADCTQVCPPGKYGMNCVQNCGHCNGTCDVVDGHCPVGCLERYSGQQCKNTLTDIANLSGCGVPVTTVVGAVAGSVLVVVLIGVGIHLCLLRKGRLQWVKVTNKDKSNQNTGDNTQMRNLGQEHVSDTEHAHSSYAYNNDYAELNAETQNGNKDYDVIKQNHYQNTRVNTD